MASTTPTKLDSLPAEIIKRIASLSPTTSVLALFLVNRHLRNVCNDEMIFKAIISNRNNEDNQYLRANREDDWSPPPSTKKHARYALADLKAQEWRSLPHNWIDCEDTEMDSTMNFCSEEDYIRATRWAPKLASLHHPFTNSLNIAECLHNLLETRSDVARLSLNFILTYALLAQIRLPILERDTNFACQILKSRFEQKLVFPYPLDYKPNIALLALSLFLFGKKNARIITIPLPSPSKIPFPADYLPAPFSNITCEDFTTSHLSEMTSKHYLEASEWVGYYSTEGSDLGRSQVPFDPPMTGIHFSVVPNPIGTNPNVETMRITANGTDNVGTFKLEGNIWPTGVVKCRKIYDNGSWWWDWNAQMTPFGIVGNWGRDDAGDDDDNQGYLWLWKKEWSE